MPTRPGQVQLVLEWRNNTVRWEELPPATRGELRTLLRDLLRDAAREGDPAEGVDGE